MSKIKHQNLLGGIFMLCLSVTAWAAGPEQLVGSWKGMLETPRGETEVTITFTAQGESLSGTISTSRGALNLDEVSVSDDGNLSYLATYNRQGTEMKITFTGKLEQGSFSGQYDFGGLGEAPFTAKRSGSGAEIITEANLIGVWETTAVYQGMSYPNSFEFTEEGGKVVGYRIRDGAREPVRDLSFRDGTLTFVFDHPEGGVVTLSAVVSGQTLKGTVSGFFGEAEVSGEKR